MAYITPQHSKKAVSRAGNVLVHAEPDSIEYSQAIEVVNNWRFSHIYPMQTIKKTLTDRAKRVEKTAITAQRLKRLSSIESKLRLLGNSQLGSMQDIGGCRAIMKSIDLVNALVDVYETANAKNPLGRPQLIDRDDYIETPKATGYRGIHLIYRYQSFTPNCQEWNGLKIEIQIRSRLQHYWATAVETASAFLGEQLKSGIGNPDWRRFFALASNVYSVMEECELVPGTVEGTRQEFIDELNHYWNELQVETFLGGCVVVVDRTQKGFKDFKRFLVTFNAKERSVSAKGFASNQLVEATTELAEREKEYEDKPEIQVVLVEVDSLGKLRESYPNFYADTSVFIQSINDIIEKYGK
jgi:ppGpp synthetase/RelA/SpoT-type nucleotidyltranferase